MKWENDVRLPAGHAEPARADSVPRAAAKIGFDAGVSLIALLAAFLNGFKIWTDHYANTYYTMAVGSMLQSFRNFFFASLDSAGSVTVDKPPLTFWIQAASARLFGLHGWSVILPQALAGVGSVLLLYAMVAPTYGKTAGRIAALAMATTPVAAAVARTNNIDAMLVFTLLLASRILFKAARNGRIGTAMLAFAVVGLAFNMKMLQAYMVLPAFYLFYIVAAKAGWRRKIGHLAAATAVLLAVSLAWAVAVDSIPADKRPYIGSSSTNSVLELAFGYNGIDRLTGHSGRDGGGGFPGGMMRPDVDGLQPGQGRSGPAAGDGGIRQGRPPGFGDGDGRGSAGRFLGAGRDRLNGPQSFRYGGFNGPGGLGGSMFRIGRKGPFRLFQSDLSGQASWLLPFAGFALVGLFAGWRPRSYTRKHREALFWLAWLLPVAGFFSVAGFFHPYYLIMLAPPVAALTGAGWSELWRHCRERSGWKAWLLPAAVLATAGLAWHIVHPYDNRIGSGWSVGILAGGILVAAVLAFIPRFDGRPARIAAACALLVLFTGPLYWAATPIVYGQSSQLPAAGPDAADERGGMGRPTAGAGESGSSLNEHALEWLKSHNTGETYLFAATDYETAAPYIIDAGEKVISLSGFSGRDPAYTVDELEQLVASGKVKYFMVGGGRGNPELASWIEKHGTVIPNEEWQGVTEPAFGTRDAGGGFRSGLARRGNLTLYEVKR